jgi:formylglycine-generating enzyme required for sulfatase activity
MKGINLFYALGTLCLLLAVSPAQGQTLAIQMYPGLTITGMVGNVYTIQATTNLAQPNGWSTFGVVQLLTTNYLWFDATSPGNIQRFYRTLSFTNVPTNMVFIPAGTFTMGSPVNEALRGSDETQHIVTISKGFYMGKYLVTQTNYVAVVGGINPSYFSTNNPDNPVEQVTWINAINYCALRTAQEQAAGLIPTNWAYRLPTESEWEYACRAGTTTAFYLGNDLDSGQANFAGQYEYDSMVGQIYYASGIGLGRTSPVGSYAANGWGLYDMIGNVCEWCQDYYGAYPAGPVTDPQGGGGSSRVARSGSWSMTGSVCRAAIRRAQLPTFAAYNFGFRVVLAPIQ